MTVENTIPLNVTSYQPLMSGKHTSGAKGSAVIVQLVNTVLINALVSGRAEYDVDVRTLLLQ